MGDNDGDPFTKDDRELWQQILGDIKGIRRDMAGARSDIGVLRQELHTFRDKVEVRLQTLEESLHETVGDLVAEHISAHTDPITQEIGDLTDRVGEAEIKLDWFINTTDEVNNQECTLIIRTTSWCR